MNFAPPIVTAFTAGLIMVMQMALLFSVVRARRRARQSIGDGGNQQLLLAIRRHGNFAENAGIFIACFTLLEITGAGGTGLVILCTGFVLGRISHIVGLSMKRTVNPFRVGGIVLTIATGTALGLRLMMFALQHLPG
jgi:uncharacterized membrane protein YecN with MAPEG domain